MKFIKVVKRGTSRVIMGSDDGEKWKSIEEVFDLPHEENFSMEFKVEDFSRKS